ncbi:MAG: NRDE family protein, partial [Deinococcota bacterium]
RMPSLPPQYHHLNHLEAIFPVDPEGGGTWVGANTAGIAVSLLNNYPEYHPPVGIKCSRGQLVTQLLSSENLEQAVRTLAEQDLRAYGSCTLVGVQLGTQPQPQAYALTWDGQQTRLEVVSTPQLWASSGTYHAKANQHRQGLFETWCQQHPVATFENLSRFHVTRNDDESELGVLMYGPAARTVSLTAVHVAEVITVHHVDVPADVARGVQSVATLASPKLMTLEVAETGLSAT